MDRMKAEKQLNSLKRQGFQKRKNLRTMMPEVGESDDGGVAA
jgi:hypothetical protein